MVFATQSTVTSPEGNKAPPEFLMNADSAGTDSSNPLQCGIKSYSTGLTWLTVLAPADPLTQNFQLRVTTNDYNLAGTYSVSIVVAFANTAFPSTITQTLSVTLLHPCKTTTISTTQTIPGLVHVYG